MLTHEEPELDVSEIIVMDPDNTFFMRMDSEAMVSYHILPDHVLVIDRTLQPVKEVLWSFIITVIFSSGSMCLKQEVSN